MNKEVIKLIRPKHYIKNILIFLPLFFSGEVFNKNEFIVCLLGFFSFSFLSSIVYIINDLKDKELDSKHNLNYKRPLASNKVTSKDAIKMLIIMIALCLIFSILLFVKTKSIYALILEIIYLILNIFYSLKLKEIPIIESVLIVSFYLIRLYYGSIITNINISVYLLLTTIFASLYLILAKRRGEMLSNGTKSRKVLTKYNIKYLNIFMHLFLILLTCTYITWSIINKYIILIPFFILIIFIYNNDLKKEYFGDPITIIYNDKILLLFIILYIVLNGIVLY